MAIPIARIEFLDRLSIRMCNNYSRTSYKEAPTLFMEFHGSQQSIHEQIDSCQEIVKMNRGFDLTYATNENERNRLWKARQAEL